MTEVMRTYNVICTTFGVLLMIFGIISYQVKQRWFISEALTSVFMGSALSLIFHSIEPLEYITLPEVDLIPITYNFTRMVLGVQLLITGVELPRRYPLAQWKSLCTLSGPAMIFNWIISSALIWTIICNITPLEAMVIGACITPTDPILSQTMCLGDFAIEHIPKHIVRMLLVESAANGGVGCPLIFLPLFLFIYRDQQNGFMTAVSSWLNETCIHAILLSILYGTIMGTMFRLALKYAKKFNWVDRSYLHISVASFALFILGTGGMIRINDVLACFVAGCTINYDDSFQKTSLNKSAHSSVHLFLNITIFLWIGAIGSHHAFFMNGVISFWRLMVLAVMILFFRRIPIIMLLCRYTPPFQTMKDSFLVGHFGSVGVSAIFNLCVALDFLQHNRNLSDGGSSLSILEESLSKVVWFLVLFNVVAFGITAALFRNMTSAPSLTKTALNSCPKNQTMIWSNGTGLSVIDEPSPEFLDNPC